MKNGKRGKYLGALMAIVALAALIGAGTVLAKPEKVVVGNLEIEFDGGFSPKALSKTKPTPISFFLWAKLRTLDGEHPPAATEFKLETDKNGSIDVKGVPVCTSGKLQSQTTAAARRVCGQAIVGEGTTEAAVKFPEQPSINVKSELLAFNGGFKGGVTTLYVHAFLNAPVTAALVTTVKIKKIKNGRFGLLSVGKIPKIAGGAGSPTYFKLKFDKGILFAKCPDGRLLARGTGTFDDGTVVSAGVVRPCTGKG